jgi:hypothetical protein
MPFTDYDVNRGAFPPTYNVMVQRHQTGEQARQAYQASNPQARTATEDQFNYIFEGRDYGTPFPRSGPDVPR